MPACISSCLICGAPHVLSLIPQCSLVGSLTSMRSPARDTTNALIFSHYQLLVPLTLSTKAFAVCITGIHSILNVLLFWCFEFSVFFARFAFSHGRHLRPPMLVQAEDFHSSWWEEEVFLALCELWSFQVRVRDQITESSAKSAQRSKTGGHR